LKIKREAVAGKHKETYILLTSSSREVPSLQEEIIDVGGKEEIVLKI